jgi:hypothetical protein
VHPDFVGVKLAPPLMLDLGGKLPHHFGQPANLGQPPFTEGSDLTPSPD